MSSRRYIEGDQPDDGTVLDAFVKLLVADPDEKDRDGIDGLVRRSLRLRGWLDAVDARIAGRAARLAAEGNGEAPTTVLTGGGRRAKRDAEAAAARGTVCARMPSVADALADGTIGAGHVDAIVNATRHLDDDATTELVEHSAELVDAAATMTPEAFDREVGDLARSLSGDGGLSHHERLRRQRNVRRWVDRHSGMSKTLHSVWIRSMTPRCGQRSTPPSPPPAQPTNTTTNEPGINSRLTPSSTTSPTRPAVTEDPAVPVRRGRRCRC